METDLLQEDLAQLPELGGPHMPGENLLVDWIRREIKIAQPNVDKFRDEYRRARRFFDGKQLTKEDSAVLKQAGRPDNAFNSAQKFIRFVTGVERTAPEALMFNPINENNQIQQQFGEFATRSYDWAINKGRGDFERSTAFEDLCVGGMGWMDYHIEYRKDPRGLPAMARFSPLEAFFPNSDRQNLEGSRWRARETYIDIDEARARWPKDRFVINETQRKDDERSYPQEKGVTEFIIYPVQTKPMNDSELGEEQKNKLQIMQFEWFDDEAGYYFFDPLEQNEAWLSKKDFFLYRAKLSRLTDLKITDWVDRPGAQFKRVFLLNRRHQLGEVIKLKRFHLNCMTGSYDEEDRLWYGYFRVLIDPQKFANKFFNQVIEIMGRSAKGGGFLYEKNAFSVNQVKDFEENFSKPGTSQEVASGAISGKKIMPKPQGELPTASMALMQFCTQMMDNVTGISPDQFNAGGANVPGVTLRQKGKSALVLLSKEFDALSRFRLDEGLIVFDLLGSLADDRLIRIGGMEDGAVVKLIHEPFATEYELMLDDTERDPNLRKMYEENVMAIAPTLIRMNMFLPELLDYTRLPYRFKKALKDAIKQQAMARQKAAEEGIPTGGGRGSPVSPQERAAKVAKTQAETGVQIARAERLRTQSKRDEIRTVMDAIVKAFEMKVEKETHGSEQAQAALDIFQQAMTGGKPAQNGARAR